MKAALDQKDLVIGNIETRCNTLEVKVKELEKENGEIEERILNQSLTVLEKSVRIQDKEIFQCETCNFTTESKGD